MKEEQKKLAQQLAKENKAERRREEEEKKRLLEKASEDQKPNATEVERKVNKFLHLALQRISYSHREGYYVMVWTYFIDTGVGSNCRYFNSVREQIPLIINK